MQLMSYSGFLSLLTLQGHPSNLHHIMATNVQMSIIRSSAPGPPLHIGASHLPRGKDLAVLSLLSVRDLLGAVHLASSESLLTANTASIPDVKAASTNRT